MEIDPSVVLILLAVVFVAVNYSVVNSVNRMLTPQKLLEPVVGIKHAAFEKMFAEIEQWGQSRGLVHEQFFLFHTGTPSPLKCSSWLLPSNNTRVLIYVHTNTTNIDFVSNFEQNTSLTTASSKDAFTLPHAPGVWVQVFTHTSDIEALYQRHLAGCRKISAILGLKPIAPSSNLLAALCDVIKAQSEYIKTLPLWFARGFFWYFINRHIKVNKLIQLKNAVRPQGL